MNHHGRWKAAGRCDWLVLRRRPGFVGCLELAPLSLQRADSRFQCRQLIFPVAAQARFPNTHHEVFGIETARGGHKLPPGLHGAPLRRDGVVERPEILRPFKQAVADRGGNSARVIERQARQDLQVRDGGVELPVPVAADTLLGSGDLRFDVRSPFSTKGAASGPKRFSNARCQTSVGVLGL